MYRYLSIAWIAFLVAAVPAVAQEPVTEEPVVQEPVAPEPVAEEPMLQEPVAETTPPAHDWEFALAPSERAPEASGTVMVVEGEPDNSFAVVVDGLPEIDLLDQPTRDVSAYTVWVVPSRDRVQEAQLAGTLVVDEGGAGRFEGTTSLDSFGIIVLASAEGSTELSGVPVLTGIPVPRPAPAAEPVIEPAPPVPPVPDAATPTPEVGD